MDPTIDERYVITLMRIFSDYMLDVLGIDAIKEAMGPSKNEGLCYESCMMTEYGGDHHGEFYLCFDGYTKLKLLPLMAEWAQESQDKPINARAVLMRFAGELFTQFKEELSEAGGDLSIAETADLSNKLVTIENEKYRQYILIFFLKDSGNKEYMGRAYLIFTINRFRTGVNPISSETIEHGNDSQKAAHEN